MDFEALRSLADSWIWRLLGPKPLWSKLSEREDVHQEVWVEYSALRRQWGNRNEYDLMSEAAKIVVSRYREQPRKERHREVLLRKNVIPDIYRAAHYGSRPELIEIHLDMHEYLASLPAIERMILWERARGATHDEISKAHNVSKKRIARVMAKAIRRYTEILEGPPQE